MVVLWLGLGGLDLPAEEMDLVELVVVVLMDIEFFFLEQTLPSEFSLAMGPKSDPRSSPRNVKKLSTSGTGNSAYPN